jgi:hypothetical protein
LDVAQVLAMSKNQWLSSCYTKNSNVWCCLGFIIWKVFGAQFFKPCCSQQGGKLWPFSTQRLSSFLWVIIVSPIFVFELNNHLFQVSYMLTIYNKTLMYVILIFILLVNELHDLR